MRRRSALTIAAFAASLLPLASQSPPTLGGKFSQLIPEQQALVQRWANEYEKITGKKLDPQTSYDALPLSSRTTFEAVTHALAHSDLTDQTGQPLGRALDLVDLVERIAGRVPQTRGDAQFRVYVYLKPNALDKLYAAREFKRDHDNTVYHIGYPINFRQLGGAPSVQFSITRTGVRADIDVDYRSSELIKAVFDGHLTAANSDVRAGNNLDRHNDRWSGFANWWQSLVADLFNGDALKADEESSGFDGPIVPPLFHAWETASKENVSDAAHAFLNEWLVDNNPTDVLRAISAKAYACIADFQDGSRPDSKLALLRILHQMQLTNERVGKITDLAEAVQPIDYPLPDAMPVDHPHANLFRTQLVPDDVAWALDCRMRYRLQLAESIPQPAHSFSAEIYATSFRIKRNPADEFLIVFWQKQSKVWKIVSFDLKRSLDPPPPDLVSRTRGFAANSNTEPKLAEEAGRAATQMLNTLLVRKRPGDAISSFSPDAYSCEPAPSRAQLLALLTELSSRATPGRTLEDTIAAPEAGHYDLQPISHADNRAFLLARVSSNLAATHACGSKASSSQTTIFMTACRSASVHDESPVVLLLFWEKRNGRWQVVSYSLVDD